MLPPLPLPAATFLSEHSTVPSCCLEHHEHHDHRRHCFTKQHGRLLRLTHHHCRCQFLSSSCSRKLTCAHRTMGADRQHKNRKRAVTQPIRRQNTNTILRRAAKISTHRAQATAPRRIRPVSTTTATARTTMVWLFSPSLHPSHPGCSLTVSCNSSGVASVTWP